MKKILFICILIMVFSGLAQAQVPRLINYQAKLTDTSGNPLEGSYDITFRIYDAETAGNLLWEEVQAGLIIQKGVFSTLFGSVTELNVNFDKPYWLAIKVGTDSEMTPRQQIAASGYALMADDVMSVPSGVILIWSGSITSIPQGWALCDGNNGTPNLTDRFVLHADADSDGINNVGDVGGSSTHQLTIAEMPAHTHQYTHAVMSDGNGNYNGVVNLGSNYQTGSTGGNQSHNNRDKYYALAYIMKL